MFRYLPQAAAIGCLSVPLAAATSVDTAPLHLTASGLSQPAPFPDVLRASDTDAQENEFGVLKVAPGVETTYYACVACHSERIVAQQGLSRAQWDDLLDWMVEEQGMYDIEDPDRSEILDYLAEHYNVDRPNFPQPTN